MFALYSACSAYFHILQIQSCVGGKGNYQCGNFNFLKGMHIQFDIISRLSGEHDPGQYVC